MNCITCNREIGIDWRKDKNTRMVKPLRHCSRSCANSRGARSEAVKLKIAQSLKGRKRDVIGVKGYKPKTYVDCMCVVCGDVFEVQAGYKKKTCSRTCSGYLRSIIRQKYIKNHGSFSTLRETFNYKGVRVDVDSNLEKAGIVYLIDILNAEQIDRFTNILNYWEGESHRTFNPDFICRIDGQACIVEVKQTWITTSNHTYNRTIPYKQTALENFCNDKNYRMIWLDFTTAPELKSIYKRLLTERKAYNL